MKTVEDFRNRKVPIVTIDPLLDKLKDQNLFNAKGNIAASKTSHSVIIKLSVITNFL